MYIELRKGKFNSNKVLNDNTILDLDKEGKILGVELLDLKERLLKKTFSEISLKDIEIPA